MNGTKSPDPATRPGSNGKADGDAPATTNGHRSPQIAGEKTQPPLVSSIEHRDIDLPDAPVLAESVSLKAKHGGDEDANSEAETLIDSPVKKKQDAEKQKTLVKSEKPAKSRIGSLPVPGDDDDDDDGSSQMESTVMSVGKAVSSADVRDRDADMMDEGSGEDEGVSDDSLSSVDSSLDEAQSRAASEQPGFTRNGTSNSPNLRKRKHRASSVNLPNKRQSMDPPKRRLRGMHSEGIAAGGDRSPSPLPQNHRRALSTQSALDSALAINSRKRRPGQFPVREPKSLRPGWEESDASSETTSRGHDEKVRPQRGIGRSTSTPGRPVPREHKRHVNKYGFTRLAEACEAADLNLLKEWRERDPDQLEIAEFAGNTPLQIAALNGSPEVVAYLIDQGCRIDCANVDKDTPLIDAAENGHLEVVNLLLEAGVDPLRQNLKGQQALDVVTDDEDDASAIRAALYTAIERWNSSEARQRREQEEEQRHRSGPSKELHFMARTYENMLRLVQNNDRNGVVEFLAAHVPVDNAMIAAAAKTGDLYLVNMLLADMTGKKARSKPEKPMMSVLGTSHFEMVKSLTELDQFDPVYRSRQGKSWPQLAEERQGPHWRQEKELLQRLYEQRIGGAERGSSSPVTKRENGKRRLLQPTREENDESDDDEQVAPATKKKKKSNGRRLMSRKDMRAAGGGRSAPSESSDEDDEESSMSDNVPAPDNRLVITTIAEKAGGDVSLSMKPPESPQSTRQPAKSRSKSISSHTSELAAILPQDLIAKRRKSSSASHTSEIAAIPPKEQQSRRRSSSLRGLNHQDSAPLPTVEEKAGEEEVSSAQKLHEQRSEAAKFALGEAQRLEAKRQQEVNAAAEAQRAEEQQRQQQAIEARKAAEAKKIEDQRKAEEARQAAAAKSIEDQRKAEEARKTLEASRMEFQRRAEEARLAEEAKKQEEFRAAAQAQREEQERLDKERVLAQAISSYRNEILTCLPPYLILATHANEKFMSDQETRVDAVVRYFGKYLYVFCQDADNNDQTLWVSNIQAGPFIGRQGMELFYRPGCPGFDESLANTCTTSKPTPQAVEFINQTIMYLVNDGNTPDRYFRKDDKCGMINTMPFEQQEEMRAKRLAHYTKYRDALANPDGPAAVRCVKLEDVLSNLRDWLRGAEIWVQVVSPRGFACRKDMVLDDTPQFLQQVRDLAAQAAAPTVWQSTPTTIVREDRLRDWRTHIPAKQTDSKRPSRQSSSGGQGV